MRHPNTSSYIKLYYWNKLPNFGDALSPYVISKITNKPVRYTERFDTRKLLAIGSILDFHALFSKSFIWGSGFLTRKSLKDIPKFNLKKHFLHLFYRSKIYALRGPLSAQLCYQAGFNVPNIFADPGILLPLFYEPRIQSSERYNIGLVMHHSHSHLYRNIDADNIKIIDIFRQSNKEIESFIDEIVSCDLILSTSLHGIIVAQAYDIPAQWITLKNFPIHQDATFKFHDYFLGMGQDIQRPLSFDVFGSELKHIKTISNISKVNAKAFKKKSNELLNAFPDINDLIQE